GRVTILTRAGGNDDQLLADMGRLAPGVGRAAHPILVVLEGESEREDDVIAAIRRQKPGVAPFVIACAFSSRQVEVLVRQGLMGEVCDPSEPRTNLFAGEVALVRQHIEQRLLEWRQTLEEHGLVLRPIFFRRNVPSEELAVLAKGYRLMLSGASFASLLHESE